MVSQYKKADSRRYPSKTFTVDNITYDLALPVNTPAKVESLLLSQEEATRNICLYLNLEKMKPMYLKKDGTISTLNGKWLDDQFTYLGSNISSTESYVNVCTAFTWITIDC